MPADQKDITIGFFVANKAQDAEIDLKAFLEQYAATPNGTGPVHPDGRFSYELRDLSVKGGVVQGVFAKFRTDQIPHIGEAGGSEREIEIAENEGLLEKNHFIYRPLDRLLVFEQNGHGSRPARLGRYVTEQAGEVLTFDPVLQTDAVERLMRGEAEMRSMRVSFARPTNPDLFPEDQWARNLMEQMAVAGGSSVALSITSDSRSDDEEKSKLSARMKESVKALMRSGYARTVRVKVEEDGIEHPIDLMADRITSVQSVTMAGKYPIKGSIYAALSSAFEEQRDAIYGVIGPPENRNN